MLDWLYTAISWVMAQWHALWNWSSVTRPRSPAWPGSAWVLAIVFLVVTIRLLLFPLFVKQVKSQRAMQELQPEIAKLRKQYGSDRQGMSQAMMALQKERGVNPLAGCLPILPQIPVFLALFHVLRRLAPGAEGLYGWSDELTDEAARAKLFGAPISASFNMTGRQGERDPRDRRTTRTIRIVAFVLIVIMCFTTFFTQKQIMKRSGPVEGQAATVQKFMLYGMPLSLFVSGFFFPIGVLLYWFTNNLWTLGQQFFILRKMPPPGSDAAQGQGRRRQAGRRPEDAGARSPAPSRCAPRPARPADPAALRRRTADDTASADGGTAAADGRRPGASTGGAADGQPRRAKAAPAAAARARPNRGKRKRR